MDNNVNGKYVVRDSIKCRYDTMGNIVEVLENVLSTVKYEYAFTNVETDDLNTIAPANTILYGYDEDSDRLLSYGEEIFRYDKKSEDESSTEDCEETAIGNPVVYRGKSVEWSHGREMTSFDGNTFTYDARGRRLTKNNLSFVYDSKGRFIKQSNGLEFIYDHTGLLAVEYNGLRYFYRKNAQNDIISLLDNDGNIVVKYVYDAWGNQKILDCNGNEVIGTNHIGKLNPFRYRSYYYDIETNLYFLKTRYYDPEICRFITIDDISYLAPDTINGLNLYAYCGNNPILNTDYSGTFWQSIGNSIEKQSVAFTKSIEFEFGLGHGIGLDIELASLKAWRDFYVGVDDGVSVAGNRIKFEFKLLVGIEVEFDHRTEQDGENMNKSASPYDGMFDMLFYPETKKTITFSFGPFSLDTNGDFKVSLGASLHLIMGGHASISFNVSEYFRRLFNE